MIVKTFLVSSLNSVFPVQIQYARSETHLIEQLDNMCEKMNNYAESTDPQTGKKSYIRTSSRSGEAVTLSNVAISGDIAQKLKHAVSYACFLHRPRIFSVHLSWLGVVNDALC